MFNLPMKDYSYGNIQKYMKYGKNKLAIFWQKSKFQFFTNLPFLENKNPVKYASTLPLVIDPVATR